MNEHLRQLMHLLFGLLIAAFIWAVPQDLATAVMATVLLITAVLSELLVKGHHIPLISWIVGGLERDVILPAKGTLIFFLATLFCLVIFPKAIVVPAFVVLSVLDSVSTSVGIAAGRHKIYGKKSLEGTLAGIIAAAVALLIFFPLPTALGTAIVAGLVELFSPVDDNITIPVSVCLVLSAVGLL